MFWDIARLRGGLERLYGFTTSDPSIRGTEKGRKEIVVGKRRIGEGGISILNRS